MNYSRITTHEKNALSKLQFSPNACTRTISTNSKGAKTDKFLIFGKRKANRDFEQPTDSAAFDDDTAKPGGENNSSIRKRIPVLVSQNLMPTF